MLCPAGAGGAGSGCVTPDPLFKTGLEFVPVFDYEPSCCSSFFMLWLSAGCVTHSTPAAAVSEPCFSTSRTMARWVRSSQYLLAVAQRVLPQLDLAEERLRQFAQGERGALRIGMECHPCYQWLLKIVAPYLASWPDVDM